MSNDQLISPDLKENDYSQTFKTFIKGRYNQGRRDILSAFLRKKCKVLLRNKISKNKTISKPSPSIFQKPLTMIDIYSKLFKTFEEYYYRNKAFLQTQKTTQKQPYSLAEDVKLFLFIYMSSNRETYDFEFFTTSFETIVKEWEFSRTIESLRDRYKRFLSKITISDWILVLKHVESESLDGILQFEGERNSKIFEKVVKITKNKEIALKAPTTKSKKQCVKEIQSLKNKLNSEVINEEKVIDTSTKEDKLDQIINSLSVLFNKTKHEVADDLDRISGDVNDLIDVYKNNNHVLFWSKEDDEILKIARSNQDVGFQGLLKEKGERNIKRRLQYQKIGLSFKWVFVKEEDKNFI